LSAGARQRLLLALLAAACAVAAAFPQTALTPIASLVAQMRAPQQAVPVARAFFVAAAIVLLLAALAWPKLAAVGDRAVSAIASWTARRFWITVAVGAIVPRALVALALPYEPTSDAAWYHEVAASLARGDGVVYGGEPTAYRSPGYAMLLAVLYRVAGPHVALAWVLGALATAVLLRAMFEVAMRLHDERVARVATLMAAMYPALVLMTGQSLSDLVFVAGLFAAFAFVLRVNGDRPQDVLWLGAAIGLLTLLRSVGGGLVALLPAVWWLVRRNDARYARAVAIAAFACAVVVLPWMVRNAIVLDRFTIGTNAGSNLLVGNRPGASGWRDAFELSPQLLAVRGEAARDDAMKAQAWAFIREHPAQALAILPGKLAGMYLLETQAVTSLFQGERRGSDAARHALYGLSQLTWMALALLVLARVASWRAASQRPRGAQWSGWLLVAYFTAICLVFHGEDRYRLPVLPWFLIEAAVVLAGARGMTQPRNRSIRPLSSSSDAN
jgi:4-amino-4-deoxy-L-arabinose transferase-like glycosyltransferase